MHFKHAAPKDLEYAHNRYQYEAHRHYKVLDDHLAKSRYMVGDTYTIVDMALWGWRGMAPYVLGDDVFAKYPNVKRLLDEVTARPAAARAIALKDKFTFKAEMDEEAKHIMFGHLKTKVVLPGAHYSLELVNLFNPAPFAILSGSLVIWALIAGRRRAGAVALLTMAGAGVTTQLLKPLLATQRDFPLGHCMGPEALPSGHTTAVMSFALALVIVSPARLAPARRGGRRAAHGRHGLLAADPRLALPERRGRRPARGHRWACLPTAALRLELRPSVAAGRRWPPRSLALGGRLAVALRPVGGLRLRRGEHDVRGRRAGDRGRARSCSAVASRLPQGLGRARGRIHPAREDEQQVREPVEVAHALGVDLVAAGQRAALGAAADGAADVQLGGGERAAGEHEGLQRGELGVGLVAGALEPRRLLRRSRAGARARRPRAPRCRRRRRTGRSGRAAASCA